MPECFIRILTPDGLQTVDYRAQSLDEAARYEPKDGIYTATRTYNTTQMLQLDTHLDRLEDSARREGIPLTINRPHLRAGIRQMIETAGMGDVRLRITIPREHPQTFIISFEPYIALSPQIYASGVRVITVPNSARHNPRAKYTGWMHARKAITQTIPEGIFTALLLDHAGNILEGITSNFYAIVQGELYTAGEGILIGTSRRIVMEIAPGILSVREQPAHVSDVPQLDEAFITSSSRGIIPVVEIDGHSICQGQPGPLTQTLSAAYIAWVDAHLENL